MIRLHIYGFNINELKSYEGSKNQEVLKKVLDELYDGDDPELDEYTRAREIAELFFNKSAKEAGFDNETQSYYYFIRALIHAQKMLVFPEFECSAHYLFGYFYDLQEKLAGSPKQIINFFIKGRSIFSDNSALSPADYPYVILTLSEITILAQDMEINKQLYKDSEGIYELLLNALHKLIKEKSDLYFNAS